MIQVFESVSDRKLGGFKLKILGRAKSGKGKKLRTELGCER
jgi:hypothetical protein